ncbi:MAG: hypothetical protein U1D55_14730 [Phycisphaerae bacterium]
MRAIQNALALLASTLAAAAAMAQGVITDGTARFEFSTSTTPGLCNYAPDTTATTDDVLFQHWLWYRIVGVGTAEARFTWPPPSQNYTGNLATLSWTGLGSSFDAIWTLRVRDGLNVGEATLSESLSLTNTTGSPLQLAVFNYADFDVYGTSGAASDDVSLAAPGRLRFEDQTPNRFCEFSCASAVAYQVSPFATLRTALDDTSVTDLNNTGVPATNIDGTGAWQWNVTVAASQTVRLSSILSINLPATAPCPGDLNGDRVVNESDLGLLLQAWQQTAGGDADGDGDTDESDLGILLQNWQVQC